MVNKQVNSGDLRYVEDTTRTILSQAVSREYSNITCKGCSIRFQSTGSNHKYCITCRPKVRRESSRLRTKEYRRRLGKQVGVGKGGANTSRNKDSQYKTGIVYFKKRRYQIKVERRYCERCKKDLINAKSACWCIHHKDHDRTNNVDSNFELLCKWCHQMEHNCANNLPN